MAKSKIENKILNRAAMLIVKYSTDDNIYYRELKKTYEEYQNLSNIDKTTKDLYLNHLDELSHMIMDSKHSNRLIVGLIIMLIGMFILTTYSTIGYYKMSKAFHNGSNKTSLVVNYDNLKNFDVFTLSTISDYTSLEPLIINLSSMDKSNDIIHYDVYLIEQNDDVLEENLLNREAFLYNAKSSSKDSGIKDLKNKSINNGKILIYSSEFKANTKENVEIRMWLDENAKNYVNKVYRYKLYVEGYIR